MYSLHEFAALYYKSKISFFYSLKLIRLELPYYLYQFRRKHFSIVANFIQLPAKDITLFLQIDKWFGSRGFVHTKDHQNM